MSELSLEWSSRAGPATLALLAGPWRRNETGVATHEVFRVHVPGDVAGAASIAAAALPAPGLAARRLLAALRDAPADPRPPEAELLRMLADPGAAPGPDDDVGRALIELAGRGTVPASVETRLGDRVLAITEIAAAGSLVAWVHADAPTAIVTLHAQAVAAALTTRAALLRVALETTQLADVIAGVAGRAAIRSALPFAWRFLHRLLAEHTTSPERD
jgi:hypothetical protein